MKTYLKKHIELISNDKIDKNKKDLNIFYILKQISEEELWKDHEYYNELELNEEEIELKKIMSFADFIQVTFGIRNLWFCNMKNIMSMENAKENFLKYSYENMITLFRSTNKERIEILHQAKNIDEKGGTKVPFYVIKGKAFPKAKRVKVTKINDSKIKEYEKTIETLTKENKDLKEEIRSLHIVVKSLSRNVVDEKQIKGN